MKNKNIESISNYYNDINIDETKKDRYGFDDEKPDIKSKEPFKEVKDLVDWKNPPSIEDLKADLQSALSNHSMHQSRVDKYLSILSGEMKVKPQQGRSKVQPKLVRKQAEWRYASMEEPFLSTNDLFKVRPVTADDAEAAWQNQLVLNKQFRVDIPKINFINKYIRTAVDTGTVILKLGWKVETALVREQVPIQQPMGLGMPMGMPQDAGLDLSSALNQNMPLEAQNQAVEPSLPQGEGNIPIEPFFAPNEDGSLSNGVIPEASPNPEELPQSAGSTFNVPPLAEEMPINTLPEDADPTLAMPMQPMLEGMTSAPQQPQEPMQPMQQPMQEVFVEKEIFNAPVIEIRDSRNVIIDPSCEGDITKAQFIIDKYITDLSTLKKDGRYHNLDDILPEDYNPSVDTDPIYYKDMDKSFNFKDKPRQKMVMYEYWGYWDIDGTGETKPIIASFIGNTIIRLEENPFPDKKFPFVVVQYLPIVHSVYGEPDAALLEDNQDIIGALTRGALDLLGRSANAQMAIRKDALDVIELNNFRAGKDFLVNPHLTPDQAFFMNTYPEIPQSVTNLITMQNSEAESITGVKAFTGGISGDALGDNVGGIRSALDATAKRELGILRRLAQGLVEAGRKIMAMNSVWLSDEEIIRVTDEEFVAIKRDDLAGNFDLILDISTAEADNQKASELAFMLQTTGNTMPFHITQMILVEIAKLRKMPELAQAMKDFKPQPDPLAERKAQLEIELLQAKIENERAKAQENQTDITYKQSRTAHEYAKAKKVASETDLKNLDYLEQSMGVTQKRELEKIAANKKERYKVPEAADPSFAMPEPEDNDLGEIQQKDVPVVFPNAFGRASTFGNEE